MLFLSIALAASVAAAVPLDPRHVAFETVLQEPWNSGAVNDFRIHASCNASQALQIREGLAEAVELAQHAKEHILRYGNSSSIYRKYFGNNPPISAIGAYEIIVHGDRANALFRCDDPDSNCKNNPSKFLSTDICSTLAKSCLAWAGHWRGNNATDETVICGPSFALRRYLVSMCGLGYNVRESPRNTFWASDLVHRLYHVPAFGHELIEHYSEGYDGIVANANNAKAVIDSDGLQYFALEAYAHDLVVPGVGCPGPQGKIVSSTSATSATTAATSTTATSTGNASPVAATTSSSATATAPASASPLPANCHTHADGAVHCT